VWALTAAGDLALFSNLDWKVGSDVVLAVLTSIGSLALSKFRVYG
jgi:hypothetical protein